MNTGEQQYVRGFNHGYLLTKHLPDLVAKLVRQIQSTTSDYLAGFFSGKEEYEIEAGRAHLDELKNIRNISHGREQDLEQDI